MKIENPQKIPCSFLLLITSSAKFCVSHSVVKLTLLIILLHYPPQQVIICYRDKLSSSQRQHAPFCNHVYLGQVVGL